MSARKPSLAGSQTIAETASRTASRTVGYCRVSSDEQALNGQSLAVQEQQLHGWAQMTNRTIDAVVVEAGVSGGIEFAKRPEGGKLLSELRKGDTLVAVKLDRFSRDLFDCLGVSQQLQDRGVALYLLDVNPADPVTGNGVSKLFMQMLGAFAEFERGRISERIKATKQRQKAKGEFSGGVAPFGWTYDDQKRLVPDPAQQAVIKRIRRMTDRGLSPHAISMKLREEGEYLSHMTVRKILTGRRWLYAA
jgi:DNA invertase Pin-like site-specific DNA recombinase